MKKGGGVEMEGCRNGLSKPARALQPQRAEDSQNWVLAVAGWGRRMEMDESRLWYGTLRICTVRLKLVERSAVALSVQWEPLHLCTL
jgi:hypothetical protein